MEMYAPPYLTVSCARAAVDLLESGVIPAGTPRMDLAKWRAGLCFTIKMTKEGLLAHPRHAGQAGYCPPLDKGHWACT